MSKVNVLFILSDQHNAKCLSVEGHPDVKTPNIDRLAQEGVRFITAIAQSPICTPSRMSFFSGQYPHNHGYYGLSGRQPRSLPNLFGHFRKQGYKTAALGKIHCPQGWVEKDVDFHREAYSYAGSGPSDYDRYLEGKGLIDDRDDNFLQEWKQVHGTKSGLGLLDARMSRLSYRDSVEGWCVQEFSKFLDTVQDEPFFAHVSLPRPHQCYTPSEPFWSMYDERTVTLPPNADYDMSLRAPHFRLTREEFEKTPWPLFEPRDYEPARRRVLRGYLGCVTQMDFAVGELLEQLEQRGCIDNTIIVYSSDHGEYAGEHGIIEKAPGLPSDAVTRIPYVWRWPGRCKAGHVSPTIVEQVDLAPTLISLTGLPPMTTCDGKDASPLLSGQEISTHQIGVTEGPFTKSVRKGKWRYVHYPQGFFQKDSEEEFGELFNLEDDPWEMENLFFNNKYRPIVEELRKDLLNWLITARRPITVLPGVDLSSEPDAEYEFKHYYQPDGKISPSLLLNMCSEKKWNYL